MRSLKKMLRSILDRDPSSSILSPEGVKEFIQPLRLFIGKRPDKNFFDWRKAFINMLSVTGVPSSDFGVVIEDDCISIEYIGRESIDIYTYPEVFLLKGKNTTIHKLYQYIDKDTYEVIYNTIKGF